ncbi:MAG: helix-turn-helix domain-containing protein [Candidatus Micrarchaeota archaeon]
MNDVPDFETLNQLKQLGLNEYESKAYHALATFGTHTAGELSERASLPRPRIYDVLTKLQEKGFVSIQQGRPVRFAALPLQEAIKTISKQREGELIEELALVENVGLELQKKLKVSTLNSPVSPEVVWTLKGRDSIYSKIGSMITGSKESVILASDSEGLKRKLAAYSKDLKKARSRGVNVSLVSPLKLDVEHDVKVKELPSRLVLADDQALLFLNNSVPPEEEIGLWIKSKHFVDTVKHALK